MLFGSLSENGRRSRFDERAALRGDEHDGASPVGSAALREGYEYVQNYFTAVLADALAMDVDFIVPELTMAVHNLAMPQLIPL